MELNSPNKAGEFQLISDEAIANRILDKILEINLYKKILIFLNIDLLQ